MVTTREMAGPTVEDLEIGEDIGRPWPNRWSLSRRGLEVLVHCARRADPHEFRRLKRKLLDAFRLEPPY